LEGVLRRPSFATVIALLALFIALGGPAEAAKVIKRITSHDVKDHSLQVRDLSRKAVKTLQTPRDGTVIASKLAPSAVTSAAIADRTINAGDIATNSLTGTQIADGSLSARELGRFYGRFKLSESIPALDHGECWSGVPAGLAAEKAGVDISQDIVLVTPDATWPHDQLSLTVKVESTVAKRGRFVLAACNVGQGQTMPFKPSFSYLILDLP
jgi:hypothetical protein